MFIGQLAEVVAMPSISSQLEKHLDDIEAVTQWVHDFITTRLHGGSVSIVPNPKSTPERTLPSILMAEFIVDPTLKTVCVYGHLDVQPASREDGWDTEPFQLTEIDGKLFGRGSTDDKGPALSWLWVIWLYQQLNITLPINVKLLFEGMEEFGSEGLFDVIVAESQPDKFLDDVDFFCISDNYWVGRSRPCITYGLRGVAYFQLEVGGLGKDLHSGVLGGTVHEPMTDLMKLMSSLVDSDGKILVDGINDSVRPVTPEEEELYEKIDFDIDEYIAENHIESGKALHSTKKDLLMARWRYPTLSLHGIEGAFSGAGAKTVIPANVKGKFSLRLVPDQDPSEIHRLVTKHLEAEFQKLNSPNHMSVTLIHGGKPWLSDIHHPNYEAASNAIKMVHGVLPDYTREGGSIPITSAIEDATGGMNVLLLPLGACDDGAHSQNEKYDRTNLVNGIKVLGMYLHELGKIDGPKPSKCKCRPPAQLTDAELMVPGAFIRGLRCACEF